MACQELFKKDSKIFLDKTNIRYKFRQWSVPSLCHVSSVLMSSSTSSEEIATYSSGSIVQVSVKQYTEQYNQ